MKDGFGKSYYANGNRYEGILISLINSYSNC